MDDSADVAVVGAGAAGLMAAIFAGRSAGNSRVVALDGASRIGAKILIAGGGRCNVTHYAVTAEDFNGNRNLIRRVLRSFDVPETRAFFETELGVRLKREETGKLFPVTDRAATVLDALLAELAKSGAELRRGSRVVSIERASDRFVIRGDGAFIIARRVVLATGGRSVPKTGSDGAGYAIARALGHTVRAPFPALVPLTVDRNHWITSLRGISHDVNLRLRSSTGRILHRDEGSMLFTHFGLSGPVVLDVSRHWIELSKREKIILEVSLFPGETPEGLDQLLRDAARTNPHLTVSAFLARRVPERLAEAVTVHAAELDPSTTIGKLTRDQRKRLMRSVLELSIPVTGSRGFDFAEVTAGGVPLEEIDTATMESRFVPGLFLCGEILDVDGRIGGFNFQWAWASGRLAGIACTRDLQGNVEQNRSS